MHFSVSVWADHHFFNLKSAVIAFGWKVNLYTFSPPCYKSADHRILKPQTNEIPWGLAALWDRMPCICSMVKKTPGYIRSLADEFIFIKCEWKITWITSVKTKKSRRFIGWAMPESTGENLIILAVANATGSYPIPNERVNVRVILTAIIHFGVKLTHWPIRVEYLHN